MTSEIVIGIISGFVGGLLVYFVQRYNESKKEKRKDLESYRIGSRIKQFVDSNFLTTYQPGNISIDKVMGDLGQPFEEYEDSTNNLSFNTQENYKFKIYKYKFKNAIILFTTKLTDRNVISLTLAHTNLSHPIDCPLSPNSDADLTILGQAEIDGEIIKSAIKSWSEVFKDWGYSALQAKFFYREIKHLTYTYIVNDYINDGKNLNKFAGRKIDQICISQINEIHPIVYYYEIT